MNETGGAASVLRRFLGTPSGRADTQGTEESAATAVKRVGITDKERDAMYRQERPFVDLLPWVEWLRDDGVYLLEDNASVGAVFSIDPVGTEGRTDAYLTDARNAIKDALQDSLDEFDVSPWVVQFYCFDENDISGHIDQMREYAAPHAKGTEYTEAYLRVLARHYKAVSKREGIFYDDEITKTQWSGRERRNYVVIYRKLVLRKGKPVLEDELLSPTAALNETCQKLENALTPAGVKWMRMRGNAFHRWMTQWFNPNPDFFSDDPADFYKEVALSEDELPYGNKFTESLFYCHPTSDHVRKAWVFDNAVSRCIKIDGIRKRPQIGHTTGELNIGDATNTMMDLLPEGAVMVTTMVAVPQDTVEHHINDIEKSAFGETSDATRTREDCQQARKILGSRNKMYRAANVVYLTAGDIDTLDADTTKARAVLLRYGYKAVAIKDDKEALDNYVTYLPMVYDPNKDRANNWIKAQLTWVEHIANACPLLGRGVGTGNPGIAAFNRGGEPLFFDPLSPKDRKNNGHMLFLGPTGAGKTANLIGILAHEMAMWRPRLFIITVGNSMNLLADWYASLGLTVNKIRITPSADISLAPFADSSLVVEQNAQLKRAVALDVEQDDDEDEEERDVLGEMEIQARLMITGGEEKEESRIRRSDRSLIRHAIVDACELAHDAKRQALTEDVRDAFYRLAQEPERVSEVRARLNDMGDAIGLFCDGFNGKVFNRPGVPWPEVDVTLIDLGTFSKGGYEAHLAISVISALNMINTIAERDQHLQRQNLVAIDEAHVISTNELLSPYLTRIMKMWRTLGTWLWMLTQNMQDYPGSAKKMLSNAEWWICLVMKKKELDEVARFRTFSEEEKQLILSTRKSPRKYTEGVVLSEGVEVLFRSVPPSLILALAMTHKEEKADRFDIMMAEGRTELEAAFKVADNIDRARGLSA